MVSKCRFSLKELTSAVEEKDIQVENYKARALRGAHYKAMGSQGRLSGGSAVGTGAK